MLSLRRAAHGALLTLLTAATATAAAEATVPTAPAGIDQDALYAPPAGHVDGARGTGIWWQEVPAGDPVRLDDATSTRRLIYRSVGVSGEIVADSATVYLPHGEAPAGGWKLVAWNHVTTGGADLCAPSRATVNLPGTTTPNPEYERLTRATNVIARLVRDGYVVVRPDYEGLGTPGPHPYLIGSSLGAATIDAVHATRELVGTASTQWAVAGQSEGGIAAAFTSALAPSLAPDLELKATAVVTPPVNNAGMVFDLGGFFNLKGTVSSLGGLMVSGAMAADPALRADYDAGQLISPAGRALFGDVEDRCLEQLGGSDSIGGLGMRELMDGTSDAARERLEAVLDESDPRTPTLGSEPVRFYAGGLDVVALQSAVFDTAVHHAWAGVDVSFRSYPFATHITIANDTQAGPDIERFITAELGS